MHSLIVTGDDFGARPGVNCAIARAYDEGILTGASLIVTGEVVNEAVALALERVRRWNESKKRTVYRLAQPKSGAPSSVQ